MKELSLFSGAGGGLLGTHLLGWRPIGYVEFNEYCQRVIAQRIADGILPVAPIFGDVREFVQSGAAREYRGFADVVTGGFPCQPFSVAGKRAGADDERNMWPATLDTIRAVRPRFCFLENVPGLISSGYFGTVIGDLAQSGYDCRWRVLSAAELGANHRRNRLWIVAYAKHDGQPSAEVGRSIAQGSDSDAPRQETTREFEGRGKQRADVADAASVYVQGQHNRQGQEQFGRASWWKAEPDVGRVVDGMAFRVDRLRAIGNGQVPAVAAAAWRLLTEDLA